MIRGASVFLALLAAWMAGPGRVRAEGGFAPDAVLFKDGRLLRGLIVKMTPWSVTLQTDYQERTFSKDQILRIRDEADSGTYFSQVNRRGSLPPWRTIANDLRTHDNVRRLDQIPATVRNHGPFRNVPYLAFRVNRNIELNIYGDPDDPAGIEAGIYGSGHRNRELREWLRGFLASFLATNGEIGALYRLESGTTTVGNTVMEVRASSSPPAGDAWWIAAYHPRELQSARLGDAGYARLTVPAGAPRPGKTLSHRPEGREADARVFLRGFHRDKDGNFRLP